jgi:high-affinity nickel permease
MSAIDSWLEGFMHGPDALWAVLLVSLLLGLRHASDPDHLAAVTTLIASEKRKKAKSAALMGFAWAATCRSGCSKPRRLRSAPS